MLRVEDVGLETLDGRHDGVERSYRRVLNIWSVIRTSRSPRQTYLVATFPLRRCKPSPSRVSAREAFVV